MAGLLPTEQLRGDWWRIERASCDDAGEPQELAQGALSYLLEVFFVNELGRFDSNATAAKILHRIASLSGPTDWDGALRLLRDLAHEGIAPRPLTQADSPAPPAVATVVYNELFIAPRQSLTDLDDIQRLVLLLLRLRALNLPRHEKFTVGESGRVQQDDERGTSMARVEPSTPRWWAPTARPWLARELGPGEEVPVVSGYLLEGINERWPCWQRTAARQNLARQQPDLTEDAPAEEVVVAAALPGLPGRLARGLLLAQVVRGPRAQTLWNLEEDLFFWRQPHSRQDYVGRLQSKVLSPQFWLRDSLRALRWFAPHSEPRGLFGAMEAAADIRAREVAHELREVAARLGLRAAVHNDDIASLLPVCMTHPGPLPLDLPGPLLHRIREPSQTLVTVAVLCRLAAHWRDLS